MLTATATKIEMNNAGALLFQRTTQHFEFKVQQIESVGPHRGDPQ